MILKKIGPQGHIKLFAPTAGHYTCILPYYSSIFFFETAWPVKAKFYVKHLYNGGINVYINNQGHMTKMAAMPIYDKNPSKSSSLELVDGFRRNLM